MSIKIEDSGNGLITVLIKGKLHQSDLVATHRSLVEQLAAREQTSVLVDARNFEGWASDGDWEDLDTQYALDPLLRKMAIVVDERWKTLASAFTGKGIRQLPIEIFTPTDFPKATAWLADA